MAMAKLKDKFELLDLLHDGETKTYHARQILSGRQILVHLRPVAGAAPAAGGDDDPLGMLWKYLKATLPEGRSKILDLGEYESGFYVATETLPAFQSLSQWLQSQLALLDDTTATVRAPGVPAVGSVAADATQSGLTKAAPALAAQQPDVTLVRPASPVTAPPPAPPKQQEVPAVVSMSSDNVEATQISPALNAALTQARDAWLAQKHPAAAPAPGSEDSAGESTMIFRAPAPSPISTPPAEAPRPPMTRPSDSGDATMVLDRAQAASAAPPATTSIAAAESSPSPSTTGEFTQLFRSPGLGAPSSRAPEFAEPEPAVLSQAAPGEFTRIFQTPTARPEMTFPAPQSDPAAPPGEFTRVFGSAIDSVLATESPAPNPPAAPAPKVQSSRVPVPAPAAKRSIVPWVIVICAAVVAAACIVYFFVLR